jgi:hypothetical protein
MDALTPADPALRSSTSDLNTVSVWPAGLPDSRLWPSDHSVSNHPWAPVIAFAPYPSACRAPRSSVGPGFASRSQAGQLSGRIELVSLRTDRSPPAAPHPASRTDAVAVSYRPERAYLKRSSTSLTTCAFRRTYARFQRARPSTPRPREINRFVIEDGHARGVRSQDRVPLLQQVSFACAVKSGSAYGVLRPGAAWVVWRRHQVAAMRSLGTKCCDLAPLW